MLEAWSGDNTQFELTEAILWEPESGYFLLDRHVQRLHGAARYFRFDWDELNVRDSLQRASISMAGEAMKVRLRMTLEGEVSIEFAPAGQRPPAELSLAIAPVDRSNPFLYYKTTNRQVYEEALANRPVGNDVLLYNKAGEITEASSSNVVFELDQQRVTPPIASGLLGGTFRAELLSQKKITERKVLVSDLKDCTNVWLINSVRRFLPASILPPLP